MTAVAFETSGAMVSVAVADASGAVRERAYRGLRQVGSTLMPTLLGLCSEANVALAECGLVAVSLGPGSFTGLRVGVATANALALALECKVVGVPSLEVLVHSARPVAQVALCLSPHRRGSFYGQLFRRVGGEWKGASVVQVGGVSEIVTALGERPEVVCGPEEAEEQCLTWEHQVCHAKTSFQCAYPSAAALLHLALQRPTEAQSRFAVPLYVRASQPEEKERAAHAAE